MTQAETRLNRVNKSGEILRELRKANISHKKSSSICVNKESNELKVYCFSDDIEVTDEWRKSSEILL